MEAKAKLWSSKPEPHDYPAAEDYLSLIMSPEEARASVKLIKKGPIVQRKAKDILRASRLTRLDDTNHHVRGDLEKIKAGERLSPVLLVRGDLRRDRPLIVADGFHRICASWLTDEDADVPCQIGDLVGR